MRFRLPTDGLRGLRHRAPAAALVAIYAYIGYHAISGSQGIMQWVEYEAKAEQLELKLEKLSERRNALQSDVDRLSASGLDLDTLDIEARQILYVARPEEITIWLAP